MPEEVAIALWTARSWATKGLDPLKFVPREWSRGLRNAPECGICRSAGAIDR
jgi:hypothetical protein